MCLDVALFRVIMFGTFWASWTWMSVSLLRLGKFLAMTLLGKSSAPFSLCPLSGTPIMWMLFYPMSHGSLKSFSLLLAVLSGWVPLLCLPARSTVFAFRPVWCWNLLLCFGLDTVFASSGTSVWTFLMFPISPFKFSVFIHSSPEIGILWQLLGTLYQEDYLSPLH